MTHAKKLLQNLADSGDEDFAAMARFELAQLDDRMGQGDEAANLYKKSDCQACRAGAETGGDAGAGAALQASNPAEAAKLLRTD